MTSALRHVDADAPPRAFTPDDIYQAIANGDLAFDLHNDLIDETWRARVYRDHAAMEFETRSLAPTYRDQRSFISPAVAFAVGSELTYDNRRWRVTLRRQDHIFLKSDDGLSQKFAEGDLVDLFHLNEVTVHTPDGDYTATEDQRGTDLAIMNALTPTEVERANQRSALLATAEATGRVPDGVSKRTLQRWRAELRKAGDDGLSGNLALVGDLRARGNRRSKLSRAAEEKVQEILKKFLNTARAPNIQAGHKLFMTWWTGNGSHEPDKCSYKSFRLRVRNLLNTRAREGSRVEYRSR